MRNMKLDEFDLVEPPNIKWLKYISQAKNINIKHACNGGEPIVMSKKVEMVFMEAGANPLN